MRIERPLFPRKEVIRVVLEDEDLPTWKRHFEKLYGHELSDDDIREAYYNLTGYFELLIKIDRKQRGKAK